MFKYFRVLMIPALCLPFLTSCAGLQPKPQEGPSVIGSQAKAVVQGCRTQEEAEGFKPGPQFIEELRDKVASELSALEGRRLTIPLTFNDDVAAAIQDLAGKKSGFMARSLARSGRYMPMIREVLREKGLPEDLAYLALIESGYRCEAYSHAHAAGMWQFIAPTGRRYGLRVDDWVDERLHPEKSTRAAADYLADLHEMFGSWYLAAAAYNAGEGKILKGLKKYNATDFWEIAQEDFLRDETKNYVPKFLAAVIIAKDPARYGLTGIVPESPELSDEVILPQAADISVIARLAGVKPETIKELNPHLKQWCTPLDEKNYPVRIPKGTATAFISRYAALKPNERLASSTHTVEWGETLSSIGKVYGLSASTIKKFNGLRSTSLRKGQVLKLPVGADEYTARKQAYYASIKKEREKAARDGNKLVYTIKPGDNPWLIAKRYELSWKDIAAWNDIKDVKRMKPGQKLVLYLQPQNVPAAKVAGLSANTRTQASPQPADKSVASGATAYTVQAGDSVSVIAARFNVSSDQIRAWNGLKKDFLRVGQVLKVAPAAHTAQKTSEPDPVPAPLTSASAKAEKKVQTAENNSASPLWHTVEADETLWRISMRYKVDLEELRRLNNLKSNAIRTGQKIRLRTGEETTKTAAAVQASKAAPTRMDKQAASPEPKLRKLDALALAGANDGIQSRKPVTYTVQKDDSLWKIARRFDVETSQIKAWNSMSGDSIKPGDVLHIHAAGEPVAAVKPSGRAVAYTVKSGDTLWKIARRFNVEPDQIKAWNSMPDNNIKPGDVLTIKNDKT